MTEKKLLLTGFEPFGDWKINPSFEAVKAFEDATFNNKIRVVVEEVPVKFREIGPRIKGLIGKLSPKMILHVGQSNRPSISVERVALNVANVLKRSYNCGTKPIDKNLVPDASAAYFATIPVRKLVEHLISKGIPAEVSYYAGTYGCNQLFYLSLHYATQMQLDAPIGFIHVPSLPEQVLDTPQIPSMPLNIIKDGLKESLNFLVHWLQNS